jgi:hypothetical protein
MQQVDTVQIINPPNTLLSRLDDGRPTRGLDPKFLAEAEKALDDLKPLMQAHVKDETGRLRDLMEQVAVSDGDRPLLDDLFRVAFELKGQGTNAGFHLVTRFADSLCRYIEAQARPGAKEMAILKAHVDSILAITGRGILGDQNPVGLAIAAELERVVGQPA